MAIWFTSDTHFGHKNSLRYCGRPFLTVEACDEYMVERWNALVKPEDTIYHLGDVAMHTKPMLRLMKRLNGHKILIIGNHDLIYPYFLKTRGQKFIDQAYVQYESVFDEIHPSGTEIQFLDYHGVPGNPIVRLSHFPTKNVNDNHPKDKHAESRPIDDGKLNICGHVHQAWLKRGNNVNVGVDVWNFQPVSLFDVWETWKLPPNDKDAPHQVRIVVWKAYHTILYHINRLRDLIVRKKK